MGRFLIGSIIIAAVTVLPSAGCGERSPCAHLCHAAYEKASSIAMVDSTGKKKRAAALKLDECLSGCE